jgi:hypothetical protein
MDRLHGELLKLVGIYTQFCSKDDEDDGAGGVLTAKEITARKAALQLKWARDTQSKLERMCLEWLLRVCTEAFTHPDVRVVDFQLTLDKRYHHLLMRQAQLTEAVSKPEKAFALFMDRLVWAKKMQRQGKVLSADRIMESSLGDVMHMCKKYGYSI